VYVSRWGIRTRTELNNGERSANASVLSAGANKPITVLLVDSQELIRGAVRQALSAAGVQVVGEADTSQSGVQAAAELRPDVVVMDPALRGSFGIQAIQQISQHGRESRVLVLTAITDLDLALEALAAGASGYVLKDATPEDLVRAVETCAAGGCLIAPELADGLLARIRERERGRPASSDHAADAIRAALSARELEVFMRLASGESNRDIAQAFSLSENTVKKHVARILEKLQLENRVQAAVEAVRSGLSCFTAGFVVQAFCEETDVPGAVVSFLVGG
jgi:DNA-binding NarL/FixJ family response regulator